MITGVELFGSDVELLSDDITLYPVDGELVCSTIGTNCPIGSAPKLLPEIKLKLIEALMAQGLILGQNKHWIIKINRLDRTAQQITQEEYPKRSEKIKIGN
jgi:hypothetical protein